MSEWDNQCISCKTLYSTLLRQYRYVDAMAAIVTQLSFDNRIFTDMICEVLFEEFSLTSVEGMVHIFIVLESFLGIMDPWTSHRCHSLFGSGENDTLLFSGVGGVGGRLNVLELIAGMKDQGPKAKFVCVFVRSFVALVGAVGGYLREAVVKPFNKVNTWAPWMLKAVFKFMNQCTSTHSNVVDLISAMSSTTPSSSSPSSASGPFLFVYGEADSEREINWGARAEKTFSELSSFLLSVGANPELLIPDDAFTGEGRGGAEGSAAMGMIGPVLPAAAGDQCSDEDLARYLQNAENFPNDMEID
jgi:hypothetical protein